MSTRNVREKIVASFVPEVRYIQSDFCRDDFKTRRLRWMSLHTTVGYLEVNLEMPGLHDEIGFDGNVIRSFEK